MARELKYTEVTTVLLSEDQRRYLTELQEYFGASTMGETFRRILDERYAAHAEVRDFYLRKHATPLFDGVET